MQDYYNWFLYKIILIDFMQGYNNWLYKKLDTICIEGRFIKKNCPALNFRWINYLNLKAILFLYL